MNKLLLLFLMCIFFVSPAFCLSYNYYSTKSIPLEISITKEISTKMPITEGQKIYFKVLHDVSYNGKTVVKRGEIISAGVETIVTSGMNGFPAEIYIDNFEIPNVKNSQIISSYVKKGQNRSFLVYPLKWSLTLIPFVGSLTNLIKGGHARIKTSDVITIYYYPEWK